MPDPDVHALAGAYALDALPEEEERFFETHLAACAACRDDVAGLRATAARLGAAAAEPAPPELRERTLAQIDVTRQEPPLLAPTRELQPRWRRLPGVLAPVAAAVIIVTVALGVLVFRLSARIDQLEAQAAQLLSVVAAEDVRRIHLGGAQDARVRLIVSEREKRALLVAEGLPQVGEDRVYELWLIGRGGPRPAGLFRPGEHGRVVEVMTVDLSDANAVAVTVEPSEGSKQPSGDPLLYGEL